MIPEPQQKSPQTSSKLTLFNSIKESHIGRNVVFEDKTLPVAEQIKSHLFSIHEQLEQLVEIAKQVDGRQNLKIVLTEKAKASLRGIETYINQARQNNRYQGAVLF